MLSKFYHQSKAYILFYIRKPNIGDRRQINVHEPKQNIRMFCEILFLHNKDAKVLVCFVQYVVT